MSQRYTHHHQKTASANHPKKATAPKRCDHNKTHQPDRDIEKEALIKSKLQVHTLADGNCCYRALAKAQKPRGTNQPGREADWRLIKRDTIKHHRTCPKHRVTPNETLAEVLKKREGEGQWGSMHIRDRRICPHE